MTTSFFIVTYRKDFPYLNHCLRSIAKFASGFQSVLLLVPGEDFDGALEIVRKTEGSTPVALRTYSEWTGMGMVHHMRQILNADTSSDSDAFCHLDADCILTKPCVPESFCGPDGRPKLQYETFESIGKRHDGVKMWQEVTQRCLPFPVHYETMRGHGMTLLRNVYRRTRELMEAHTGMSTDKYLQSVREEYPQGWCEFVTLGNVAMHDFVDEYYLVDNSKKENPDLSDFPVGQFWSHGAIDQPQPIWWDGNRQDIVPIKKISEVLDRWYPTPDEEERMRQ